MKFRYDGPHDAVELDGHGVIERGHQVEAHGAEAESLDRQSDWTRVDKPKPRKKPAVKKAAAKTPEKQPPAETPDDAEDAQSS